MSKAIRGNGHINRLIKGWNRFGWFLLNIGVLRNISLESFESIHKFCVFYEKMIYPKWSKIRKKQNSTEAKMEARRKRAMEGGVNV